MDWKKLRKSDNVFVDIPQFENPINPDYAGSPNDELLQQLAHQYVRLTTPPTVLSEGEDAIDLTDWMMDNEAMKDFKGEIDNAFFGEGGKVARTLTQDERYKLLWYINHFSKETGPDPTRLK